MTSETAAIEKMLWTYLDGLHEGDADKIAMLWAHGADIPWRALYGDRRPRMQDETTLAGHRGERLACRRDVDQHRVRLEKACHGRRVGALHHGVAGQFRQRPGAFAIPLRRRLPLQRHAMAAAAQRGQYFVDDSLRFLYPDFARGQLSSKSQRPLRSWRQCQRMVLGQLRSGAAVENVARRVVVSIDT